MVRLRNAILGVGLLVGGVGCTFCDECDDFPIPGGPGGYSMMPGSYTGPPMERPVGANAGAATAPPSAAPAPTTAAPAQGAAAADDAELTPPPPPAADAPR